MAPGPQESNQASLNLGQFQDPPEKMELVSVEKPTKHDSHNNTKNHEMRRPMIHI